MATSGETFVCVDDCLLVLLDGPLCYSTVLYIASGVPYAMLKGYAQRPFPSRLLYIIAKRCQVDGAMSEPRPG